ncbi:MAG: tRNA (adenosine(37)-N6)-threonylcarbamoyltransferase complex ATPase subunit type 1 TsaE [Lentisphaeria bacterium]|nr:tRNA (adenosine(37)-N6)-threonylcarbamoyltransferase complex ATPase subunit type 1 TsaE [Lentisphaeria bacterium]NQZ67879.1 tRNA (adenosine(37)-N6)-threonylcarbamoyltransferase complex ATPase subunit type 1 TsaE [Lentisphaeria bacterium]
MNKIVTKTEDDTFELGLRMGGLIKGGQNIALRGNLGAGKTVLSRGIARGLGISDIVTSPTFTIAQEYSSGRHPLFHLDLYRLTGVEDALAFGIEDYLNDADAVCIVEWSDRISELVDDSYICIDLAHVEGGRLVEIYGLKLDDID